MKKQPGGNPRDELVKHLASLKGEDYCYLTTTGRVTGRPHEIEIWFGLQDATLYLLAGGRDKSDWVKNALKNPAVIVRLKGQVFNASARLVRETEEEKVARDLLADKYQERETDGSWSEWARTALPVAIDLSPG